MFPGAGPPPLKILPCLLIDSLTPICCPSKSIGPGVDIPNTCDGVSLLADAVVNPLISSDSKPCPIRLDVSYGFNGLFDIAISFS